MAGTSILLVTQFAPPSTLVAARRTAGLAKYLSRLGHRVTVLTSAVSGDGEVDGAERVVRTRDLVASGLNWRRGHFSALSGTAQATYGRPSRLEAVVVPDLAAVTWLPFALPRALALARRQRFDCVITSSPPQSAHLAGLALALRVPWIAELRDGWTFEPPHSPWPLGAQRRADSALERRVAQRASALVGVTAPIVEDARERLGVPATLITNGFDPEDPAAEAADLVSADRHSLVHTGRMGSAGSSPQAFLAALRLLRAEQPAVAGRFEVVFAGPLSAEEAELLAAPDLAELVRTVGMLERPRALGLQRAADSLLVVTEGAARRSVATGKLFEYLGAGRPILVLGAETEAARIVQETSAGFSTSAHEPSAIAAALARLVTSPPAKADPAAVERYAYAQIARRYSELVDEVVSRRSTGASAAATSRGR